MNISRRRKSHLSTVRTARSLAGLFIVSGFLMLVLSATVGALLFQTDIQGVSADFLLDAPSTAQGAPEPVDAEPTGTHLDSIKASIDTQHIKSSLSNFVSAFEWNDLWKLTTGAFILLWLGYVLRVVSVLAETQLIDFQQVG